MIVEADIQRAVMDTLIYDGWLVLRINCGGAEFGDDSRYVSFVRWQAIGFMESSKGVSDVIASKGGQTIYVECKAPGEELRESQKVFRAAVESVGVTYVVADSVKALRPYLERIEL